MHDVDALLARPSALALVAIGLQAASVLTNIAVLRTLEGLEDPGGIAVMLAVVLGVSILAAYGTEVITNLLAARTDIGLRRALLAPGLAAPSRANNDVALAVGVISFRIYAPAQVLAFLAYATALAVAAPAFALAATAVGALLVWPLRRFVIWRGDRIGGVRQARNVLLDRHAETGAGAAEDVSVYGALYTSFVLRDALAGLCLTGVACGALVLVAAASEPSEALANTLLMALVLGTLRSLVVTLSVHQENSRSARAILTDLRPAA